MTTLAFIDQFGGWWNELTIAKQLFYGIGLLAGIVSIALAILAFIGMEHGDVADVTAVGGAGGGMFSIKPLTGFFLGFGWAGGLALDAGLSLTAALALAFGGGALIMVTIVGMIRAIYGFKSDGTARIDQTVGAVGTIYVTVPPRREHGGQVIVNFSGRQETFDALSAAERPIPSGYKVRVVSVVDGRTVLVESL